MQARSPGLRNVTKMFGGQVALDDVSFTWRLSACSRCSARLPGAGGGPSPLAIVGAAVRVIPIAEWGVCGQPVAARSPMRTVGLLVALKASTSVVM